MREVFTAKRIEDAKQMAAEAFGVSEDQIVFRILEEPKRGFLGFGKKGEAKVEAIYEVLEQPKPERKPEIPAAVFQEPEAPEPKEPEQMSKPEEQPEKPQAEKQPEQLFKSPEQSEKKEGKEQPKPEPRRPLQDEELLPSVRKARDYVCAVYREMGVPVTAVCYAAEGGVLMELSSQSKSGAIIGRRGETLDALQYLASVIANKGLEEYFRLTLDSNGYREKRKKTLEQLAEKIARNVLRSGRATTLEPMNPYERRIIHSKVASLEGVTSRSIGEDPHRRVVISAVGARRDRRGGKDGGSRRPRSGGKKPYRDTKRPEDFKQSSLDSLKTSFEKDYKKPKPEDDIHAGLYGKIEL